MTDPRSHLIVALDLPDRLSALSMADQLSGHIGYFKIGLELFTREGPRLVEEIRDRGEKVFLDLKLHDIPNTVRGAVRSACRLGIQMLTLHASGGRNMLTAARQETQSFASPPLLLAVTALTSLSDEEIHQIGVADSATRWVERLAEIAHQSGVGGLVSSTGELPMLQRKYEHRLQYVIPGIRPPDAALQDQSRTATPTKAMQAGADYIVVGRPILQAPDPIAAADAIVAEIKEALILRK